MPPQACLRGDPDSYTSFKGAGDSHKRSNGKRAFTGSTKSVSQVKTITVCCPGYRFSNYFYIRNCTGNDLRREKPLGRLAMEMFRLSSLYL